MGMQCLWSLQPGRENNLNQMSLIQAGFRHKCCSTLLIVSFLMTTMHNMKPQWGTCLHHWGLQPYLTICLAFVTTSPGELSKNARYQSLVTNTGYSLYDMVSVHWTTHNLYPTAPWLTYEGELCESCMSFTFTIAKLYAILMAFSLFK